MGFVIARRRQRRRRRRRNRAVQHQSQPVTLSCVFISVAVALPRSDAGGRTDEKSFSTFVKTCIQVLSGQLES